MYIVMHRCAKMPSSVRSKYRRVAVVEISDDMTREPAMISERAKGVIRIVQTWERLHAGTRGGNTAFDRALRDAEELARRLDHDDSEFDRAIGFEE